MRKKEEYKPWQNIVYRLKQAAAAPVLPKPAKLETPPPMSGPTIAPAVDTNSPKPQSGITSTTGAFSQPPIKQPPLPQPPVTETPKPPTTGGSTQTPPYEFNAPNSFDQSRTPQVTPPTQLLTQIGRFNAQQQAAMARQQQGGQPISGQFPQALPGTQPQAQPQAQGQAQPQAQPQQFQSKVPPPHNNAVAASDRWARSMHKQMTPGNRKTQSQRNQQIWAEMDAQEAANNPSGSETGQMPAPEKDINSAPTRRLYESESSFRQRLERDGFNEGQIEQLVGDSFRRSTPSAGSRPWQQVEQPTIYHADGSVSGSGKDPLGLRPKPVKTIREVEEEMIRKNRAPGSTLPNGRDMGGAGLAAAKAKEEAARQSRAQPRPPANPPGSLPKDEQGNIHVLPNGQVVPPGTPGARPAAGGMAAGAGSRPPVAQAPPASGNRDQAAYQNVVDKLKNGAPVTPEEMRAAGIAVQGDPVDEPRPGAAPSAPVSPKRPGALAGVMGSISGESGAEKPISGTVSPVDNARPPVAAPRQPVVPPSSNIKPNPEVLARMRNMTKEQYDALAQSPIPTNQTLKGRIDAILKAEGKTPEQRFGGGAKPVQSSTDQLIEREFPGVRDITDQEAQRLPTNSPEFQKWRARQDVAATERVKREDPAYAEQLEKSRGAFVDKYKGLGEQGAPATMPKADEPVPPLPGTTPAPATPAPAPATMPPAAGTPPLPGTTPAPATPTKPPFPGSPADKIQRGMTGMVGGTNPLTGAVAGVTSGAVPLVPKAPDIDPLLNQPKIPTLSFENDPEFNKGWKARQLGNEMERRSRGEYIEQDWEQLKPRKAPETIRWQSDEERDKFEAEERGRATDEEVRRRSKANNPAPAAATPPLPGEPPTPRKKLIEPNDFDRFLKQRDEAERAGAIQQGMSGMMAGSNPLTGIFPGITSRALPEGPPSAQPVPLPQPLPGQDKAKASPVPAPVKEEPPAQGREQITTPEMERDDNVLQSVVTRDDFNKLNGSQKADFLRILSERNLEFDKFLPEASPTLPGTAVPKPEAQATPAPVPLPQPLPGSDKPKAVATNPTGVLDVQDLNKRIKFFNDNSQFKPSEERNRKGPIDDNTYNMAMDVAKINPEYQKALLEAAEKVRKQKFDTNVMPQSALSDYIRLIQQPWFPGA